MNSDTIRQTISLQLRRLFCVTDRSGVQRVGRGPSPCPQTLTCNQTAMRSPRRPFEDLHPVIHVITNTSPKQLVFYLYKFHWEKKEGFKSPSVQLRADNHPLTVDCSAYTRQRLLYIRTSFGRFYDCFKHCCSANVYCVKPIRPSVTQ